MEVALRYKLLYTVYTAYIAYTASTAHSIYIIQIALHCLNSSIVREEIERFWNGLMSFWKKCGMDEWSSLSDGLDGSMDSP